MAKVKTVAASTNTLLAGLQRTTQWDSTALTRFFATAADSATIDARYQAKYGVAPGAANPHDPIDTTSPFEAGEQVWYDAAENAIDAFSLVSGLSFSDAASIGASDIVFSGGYGSTAGVVAWMNAPGSLLQPGETDQYQSFLINRMGHAPYEVAAERGGADFATFVIMHELGHGLGLSHPHNADNGTTAWADSAANATDNKADNARYTVMSYEIGGIDTRVFTNFGNNVTPAALDIAALQAVYGTAAAHTGNTTYTITDQGSADLDVDGSDNTISVGRAFYTIWDTGGDADAIEYSGARNAYINLNDATLVQTDTAADTALLKAIRKTDAFSEMTTDHGDGATSQPRNELTDADYHAGGYYSTVSVGGTGTQLGGYSIANGVVIENATSGTGKDMLIGNEAANTLESGGGDDMLAGADGNDTLKGGAGDDEMIGGGGDDRLEGGAGDDVAFFTEACRNYEIEKADDGTVTIRHTEGSMADGTDTLIDVETARFSDGDIDLTGEEIEGCPPLDFIFLVDLSGSFGDDLANFRDSARQIAADLRADNPDVQFAIASFIDRPESPWGGAGDYLYRPELELTDDAAAFETALAGLSTGYGGDGPEAQWVGLWRAANGVGLNLRDGSSRVIYMATDAPAHDASDYGLDETTIRDFLENEGIDREGGGPALMAPPAAAAAAEGSAGAAGAGDPDAIEVEPDPRDPEDPGYDTGAETDDPTGDALIGAVGAAFRDMSAIPIIGTSGRTGDYDGALEDMGSGGVVVTTSGDSRDVADAVRAGMATIRGSVTESGTAGNDSLVGTEDRDVLLGLGGNDTLEGLGGNDDLDGGSGNDSILGGDGDDKLDGGTGDDEIDGGAGNDTISSGAGTDTITTGAGADLVSGPASSLNGDRIMDLAVQDAVIVRTAAFFGDPGVTYDAATNTSRIGLDLTDDSVAAEDFELFFEGDITAMDGDIRAGDGDIRIGVFDQTGTAGEDTLDGNAFDNTLDGLDGDDLLRGWDGDDTLRGGDGNDTINGGDGDDHIVGGETGADLRDLIFGGAGNDTIDAGYGNDEVYGGSGNDTIAGGFGVDTIEGQDGNDVITGSAFSDQVFGGNGDDFVNGGFGHDRVNGGAGADKFFHVGIEGHGSDWIQDYDSAEGDVLVFGNAAASASDFQVNFAHTADSAGERAGADDVMEAFVIYKPTGQIMWALVDGQGQASIDLSIGGGTPFDLLA